MPNLLYPPHDHSALTELQAVELNFASQGLLFGGWVAGVTSYHEERDNLRFTTGLNSMYLNGVSWSNFAVDALERRVYEVTEDIAHRAAAASWSVLGSQPHRQLLERGLEGAGWTLMFEACGMCCDLESKLNDGQDDRFRIERVTTPQMMEDWLPPFMAGFDFPRECSALLRAAYGKAATEYDFHYKNFVLYDAASAICSGSLQTVNGCAVIYNIATLPDARKRGAASAMIGFLKSAAKAQGFKRVSLFSLPAASALYETLGFERDHSTTLLYGRS